MRKIILLTTVFLILTLISCAESIEVIPEYDAGFSETNLDGYNFRIMQDDITENTLHYNRDTLFYDFLIKRIADIQTEYNCKIDVRQYAPLGSAYSYAQAQIVSGDDFADVFFGGTANNQMSMAQSGFLLPLDEVSEYLDYQNSEKFGALNILEAIMYKGDVYGVVPALWPNKLTQGNIGAFIAFNENIISKYSMPNPREIHETGGWTTENFTKITPDFYTKDGETEVFSLMGHPSNFARGFLGSAGMKLVTEVEGKWVPSYETREVLDMIEWAREYSTLNEAYIRYLTVYTSYENLINGETTMCITETGFIDRIAFGLENFGVLPFPAGPDIEYDGQLTYFSTVESFSIFVSTPEPEASAIVLNALLEPFEGYETADERNSILFKTIFYNQNDVDYYTKIHETTIYQYFTVQGYQFIETIASNFLSKPASEIIGQLSGTMDHVIENYIAPNYNAIYK